MPALRFRGMVWTVPTDPDSSPLHGLLEGSSEGHFAEALAATVLTERGYRVPDLTRVVTSLGITRSIRWLRGFEATWAEASVLWDGVCAHLLLGCAAAVDDCWGFAVAHFSAAKIEASHTSDPLHLLELPALLMTRSLPTEARLPALLEQIPEAFAVSDTTATPRRDALARFLSVHTGEVQAWDTKNHFLARLFSTFEALQGLDKDTPETTLLAVAPLTAMQPKTP